jgi:hypothetical protein
MPDIGDIMDVNIEDLSPVVLAGGAMMSRLRD